MYPPPGAVHPHPLHNGGALRPAARRVTVNGRDRDRLGWREHQSAGLSAAVSVGRAFLGRGAVCAVAGEEH